jgi:hypothetical protein
LIDEDGNAVPDSVTFGRNQRVRAMAIFQAPVDSAGVSFPFTYRADFSEVDSEFSFANPAVLDSVVNVDLPDSLLAPGYRTFARVEFSYVLSEANTRPEGRHEIVIRAADTGCGEAFSDSIFVTIDDLRPPPPVLDVPAIETATEDTFVLTGSAPEADLVVLTRDADDRSFTAELDTLTSTFRSTVALEPGANSFTALARGPYDHPSLRSNAVSVFRTTGVRLELPSRFRPGDVMRVTALENTSRIDLDVFDMASSRVWHASVPSPGSLHEFAWDGRNLNGDRVLSGPYLARVTLILASGKRTLHEAFVFTRK